jgi:hypothetical protein
MKAKAIWREWIETLATGLLVAVVAVGVAAAVSWFGRGQSPLYDPIVHSVAFFFLAFALLWASWNAISYAFWNWRNK